MSFTANAQNWELLHKPKEDRYVDILSNENSAYLLVYQSGMIKLYQTTDDGSTWKRIIEREDKINIVNNFTLISDITDDGFIFIPVGSNGEIVKVKTNPNILGNLKIETKNIVNSIDMLDESRGIASTDTELFITNDSWLSSEKMNISDIQSVGLTKLSMSFITYNEETGNKYYRSIDGGKTWDSTQIGNLIPEKIYFTNDDNGFLVGKRVVEEELDVFTYYDMIYKTTDNGITWNKVLENKKESFTELFDIEFKNNIGIASGLTSSVYTTYDSGANWEKQSLGELEDESYLPTVCGFLNNKFLLAIRNKGVYSKQDPTLSVENDNAFNIYGIDIQEDVINFKNSGVLEYEIFGLDGDILKKGSFSSEINIENLNTGVYFLRLNNKEVLKFLKNN